jgi:hypothetical protein
LVAIAAPLAKRTEEDRKAAKVTDEVIIEEGLR